MPSLYGIYEVETDVVNKDTIEPLLTDEKRWLRFIMDKYNANITKMNGKILYVRSEVDTTNATIKIAPYSKPLEYHFQYGLRDSVLVFSGTHCNDSLRIEFRLKDRNEFHLMNRGFHWIN